MHESSDKVKAIYKAKADLHQSKAALRQSIKEICSERGDQKITKWVKFHIEDDDEDGHGSQQPGNAKISSEAERGCKEIPPLVAGSPGYWQWFPA